MSGSAPSCAAPEQFFLPMFLPHEEEALKQAYAKRLENKEKNRLKYQRVSQNPRFTSAIDNLSASLLDLPLGQVEDVELSTTFDPYIDHGEEDPESLSDDEAKVWSEEAIKQLHEGMVMYSLRLLNARGNGKEKKAILSWIFDPHAMAYAIDMVGEEPLWKIINASEVPFGFELCCRLSGYDPERIREGLVPILKQLDLDELFKEVEHERDTEQRIRATELSNTVKIQYARGAGKSGNSRLQGGAPRSAERRSVTCLGD